MSLQELLVSLQVCVSCMEPPSERGRVCVRQQESPGQAWVSQLQHCAADSAADFGLVSCVQSWIKMGSAEASGQNDRRTRTGVLLVAQNGPTRQVWQVLFY